MQNITIIGVNVFPRSQKTPVTHPEPLFGPSCITMVLSHHSRFRGHGGLNASTLIPLLAVLLISPVWKGIRPTLTKRASMALDFPGHWSVSHEHTGAPFHKGRFCFAAYFISKGHRVVLLRKSNVFLLQKMPTLWGNAAWAVYCGWDLLPGQK